MTFLNSFALNMIKCQTLFQPRIINYIQRSYEIKYVGYRISVVADVYYIQPDFTGISLFILPALAVVLQCNVVATISSVTQSRVIKRELTR